jgi:hypothetical protein
MSTPLQRRTVAAPSQTPPTQTSSVDRRTQISGGGSGGSAFCSLGTLKVVVAVFLIGYNLIWSGLSLIFFVEPTIAEVNKRAAETPELPMHASLSSKRKITPTA